MSYNVLKRKENKQKKTTTTATTNKHSLKIVTSYGRVSFLVFVFSCCSFVLRFYHNETFLGRNYSDLQSNIKVHFQLSLKRWESWHSFLRYYDYWKTPHSVPECIVVMSILRVFVLSKIRLSVIYSSWSSLDQNRWNVNLPVMANNHG